MTIYSADSSQSVNLKTRNVTKKIINFKSVGDPFFQVFPTELVFKDFEPFKSYRNTISFRNTDTIARRIKVCPIHSSYFKILGHKVNGNTCKVAPGLEITCEIMFTPEESVDYRYDLQVVTDSAEFTVPIRSIGMRVPVKFESSKTICILNSGKCPTNFAVKVQEPFKVTPSEVSLGIDKSVQIVVSFFPHNVGKYQQDMIISYENGDVCTTSLNGEAENINVNLSISAIDMPATFISQVSQQQIKITNNSSYKVQYKWKSHEFHNAEFHDDVFTISPLYGHIWPNTEYYMCLDFHPSAPDDYERIAYCDIEGREYCLPLKLSGKGKGPEVSFSTSKFNVKQVFINSKQECDIQMENKGSIDAEYHFIPSTSLFGSKVKFSPNSGVLKPNETQVIKLEFCSDIIGKFMEIFKWRIIGRKETLNIIFVGEVVGPSFQFNTSHIDFGLVSYNFLNIKHIQLTNTSEIPMKFKLRVPEDGALLQREFDILPASGVILPQTTRSIKIEFLSNTIKKYKSKLVLDVGEVGENLHALPITAECIVPDILLSCSKINFGDCFIGYKYVQTLDLGNKTTQPAKYEITFPSQEENSKIECSVDQAKGIVPSKSTHKVKIHVITKTIGSIYVPLYVRIVGSDKPPFEVSVSACSIGPVIELSSSSVDFSKVEVLKDHIRVLQICNKSPIPAPITASFKSDNKLFRVERESFTISPNSNIDFPITVHLDDTLKFTDTLILDVENGEKLPVSLVAVGKGSSIVSSTALDTIDFKHQFTQRPCTIKFKLQNMGRRNQTIQWVPAKAKKRDDTTPQIFKFTPERATIAPRTFQEFEIEGFSQIDGEFEEQYICKNTGKKTETIFSSEIRCIFTVPLIKCSHNSLNFEYTYSYNRPPLTQILPVVVKNVSPLPLQFFVKPIGPFSAEKSEYIISTGESLIVNIIFDPAYNNSRQSHTVKTKIIITYKDHPQKDFIEASASINFPTLDFSANQIDFGAVLNETEKRRYLLLTNNSKVEASYNWVFIKGGASVTSKKSKEKEVFDVLPIRGRIKPGDSIKTEFIYNGTSNKQFKWIATCQVDGGTDYDVELFGESSNIEYKFDKTFIDFGIIHFDIVQKQEIYLMNPGKVSFDFTVDIEGGKNSIQVSPEKAIVKGGDRQKLTINFLPGIPEEVNQFFKVHVSHFQPEIITIHAISLHPSLQFPPLQRLESEDFLKYLDLAKKSETSILETITGVNTSENESTSKPSRVIVEYETERLILKDHLKKHPLEMIKRKPSRGLVNTSSRPSTGSTIQAYRETPLIISRYILDFGNVIRGTVKKKPFKIINIGYLPTSIKFDKKELLKNGFSIEPVEAKKIPGFPNNESLHAELTFQTKQISTIGQYNSIIEAEVYGGSRIQLQVRANIVTPELEVSETSLDFGSIYVGQCKIMTVQLENLKEIPCEWFLEFPEDARRRERRNGFTPTPTPEKHYFLAQQSNNGVLKPGEKYFLEISFIPEESKNYSGVLILRFGHNPKVKKFTCTGCGEEIHVELSPSDIEIGPVLPYSPQDSTFSIKNNSSCAIEVYSIEYDKKYIEEDEILSNTEYIRDGYVLIPPRSPGDPLPLEALNSYEKKTGRSSLTEEKKNEEEEMKLNIEKEDKVTIGDPINDLKKPEDYKHVFLIYGTPYSGKTTLASHMSSEFSLPILELEKIIPEMPLDTPRSEYEKNLVDSIREKLNNVDYERGFIIDDFPSDMTTERDKLMKLLIQASLPLNLYFIFLSLDELSCLIRGVDIDLTKAHKEMEDSRVEMITEEDFDRFDEEKKSDYSLRLKLFRTKKLNYEKLLKKKEKLEREKSQIQTVEQLSDTIIAREKRRLELLAEKKKKPKKQSKKSVEPVEEPEIKAPEEEYKILETDDIYTGRVKRFKLQYIGIHKIVNDLVEGKSDEEKAPTKKGSKEIKESKPPQKIVKSLIFDASEEEGALEKHIYGNIPNIRPPPIVEEPVVVETSIPPPVIKERVKVGIAGRGKSSQKLRFEIFQLVKIENAHDAVVDKKKKKQVELEPQTELLPRTRWILDPNSHVDLFVRFISSEIGKFDGVLSFGVVNRENRYKIKCKGICAVPEISTYYKSIFLNRIKSRPEKGIISKKYIQNEKTFEFGPLLVRKYDNYKQKKNEYLEFHQTFSITNNGLYNAEVSFTLEKDSDKVFLIDPEVLNITRDSTSSITVWALPSVIGPSENSVICTVKDNPIPFMFKIACIGAKPSVEVDQKSIEFGKLLLSGKTVSKSIVLRNTSSIAVSWKISNIEKVTKEFIVTPPEGVVEYGRSCEIVIEFKAEKPCELKDSLIIEYGDCDRVIPTEKLQLAISGEAFDLNDISLTDAIEFGVVKVSDGGTKQITLSSGKNDVSYTFSIPKHLKKMFSILHKDTKEPVKENILKAKAKPTLLEVLFQTKKEISLSRNNEIECLFLDTQTKEVLGKQPIHISVTAVFSKYEINPSTSINFGPLNFGQEKQKALEITNTGSFDISFTIVNYKEGVTDQASHPAKGPTPSSASPKSKPSSRSSSRGTSKKKGKAMDELLIGKNFKLCPSSGVIQKGTKKEVIIKFIAHGSDKCREMIALNISDRDPSSHPGGIPIELQGESCVPGIAASNFTSIFEEQHVVKTVDVLDSLQESAFCTDAKIFSFGTIVAGNKAQERLKIPNPFKVPCTVDFSLKPREGSPNVATDNAFDVQPRRIVIPPHEHRYITLYFNPATLNLYTAVFEALVVDGQDPQTKELKMELRGRGLLPQVVIVLPRMDTKSNDYRLLFPRTLVGRTAEMPVVVRNDSILPATIRFDVPKNEALTFSHPSREIPLGSKQSEKFVLHFEPTKHERIESILKLIVQENPSDTKDIKVVAEGYLEDLTFENLPKIKDSDILDLGDCDVGMEKRNTFILTNNCQDPIRFVWDHSNRIGITPAMGHIQAFSSKDITISFTPPKPSILKDEVCKLKYKKIKYAAGSKGSEIDWDDRQKKIKWEYLPEEEKPVEKAQEMKGKKKSAKGKQTQASSPTPTLEVSEDTSKKMVLKKVERIDPEPSYNPVSDEQWKQLQIKALSDYARFETDMKSELVKFKTTNMFESRTFRFTYHNIGKVSLRYKWEATTTITGVLNTPPFTINPKEGSIEVGESTDFCIQYAPMEVDLHEEVFKCEIPNLASDLDMPKIITHGDSQCPIVHFELTASDYITGGRRKTDHNLIINDFQVDASTKVIEIHSCGIRINNSKKFFILNPTNISYDFEWKRIFAEGESPDEKTFTCLTKRGTISSGKKFKVIFEYLPQAIETRESYWKFCIPEHSIEVPFILVGTAMEPKVYLDTARVNFQTVLVGLESRNSIRIINKEKIPFNFSFEKSSFHIGEDGSRGNKIINLTPSHGVIPAEQDTLIDIIFCPQEDINYNFNLVCNIRKKPTPLNCNVKGEGFKVHERVELQMDENNKCVLIPKKANNIEFGRIKLNEQVSRKLIIHNEGKYNFDFSWTRQAQKSISISPEVSTVAKGQSVECEIQFCSPTEITLSSFKCVCKITNGNSYVLHVNGNASPQHHQRVKFQQ